MSMPKKKMIEMLYKNNLAPLFYNLEEWTKRQIAEHMGVYNKQTRHVNEKDFERACFRRRKKGEKI